MDSSAAKRRLNNIATHLNPQVPSSHELSAEACAAPQPPKKYDPTLRWNGYGYADTTYFLNKDGSLEFKGPKYELHTRTMPNFTKWAEAEVGFTTKDHSPSQQGARAAPAPIVNAGFLDEVKGHYSRIATDDQERVFHGHGHTVEEIYKLRHGQLGRIPDVVIYPGSNAHVETIVRAAKTHNVVIIPFGGGTNVTNAVTCPEEETRCIVSLDMRDMCKVKWVDLDNMMACIEAGANGEQIETQLKAKGVCFGHEPDSFEFSTLGGWISTRASGMKKNVYGNIEDLVISTKLVTPTGVLEQPSNAPRISCGPDVNELLIGSEGNFGVITEAIVKIKKVPACQKFGAVAFPTFAAGFNTLRELAQNNCFPASIRLIDNEQFRFASALKVDQSSWHDFIDSAKKFYVTKIKGFDVNQLCAATVVFEDTPELVEAQEKLLYQLAKKHGGLKSDAESGRRGYMLTYMIAYIRDVVMDYGMIAESFETSVPYSQALQLCDSVKKKIKDACLSIGVKKPPFVCCRITQLYSSGVACYFYFALNYKGLKADPVQAYLEIENEARAEILKQGGSISHHHGIGKLRAHFIPEVTSPQTMNVMRAVKQQLDPTNVFAARNMGL